jgi:hypothetical protein
VQKHFKEGCHIVFCSWGGKGVHLSGPGGIGERVHTALSAVGRHASHVPFAQ